MFSANPDGSLTRRRSGRSPGVLVAGLAVAGDRRQRLCARLDGTSPPHHGASASAAASASASCGGKSVRQRCGRPELRDRSGRPERHFETGFDIPFKLSDEFTKQFPNVTWKISQDQFSQPHEHRRRGSSRATTPRT